jgi:NAD(P)-dependent dehydrogenase (short-subunit alcohol dehydrogenase family)
MIADFDLTGTKVLVTGAGRGIGKGIALAMAEAGADVGVTALGQPNATRVAEEISALGRRGIGWAADGTHVDSMQVIADDVLSQLGGLDVLINCIGDAIRGAVAPGTDGAQRIMTESDWHAIVDVNLTQAFVGCHVFGPHLLAKRSGSVINVSSFAAIRPAAQTTAYAAAKAGLTRFTESLALEWAPHGVRVNAIAPGTFPDPEQVAPEDLRRRNEQAAPTVPLGRLGLPREVGLLAVFLSSSAASYITGQSIAIDGGRTLL